MCYTFYSSLDSRRIFICGSLRQNYIISDKAEEWQHQHQHHDGVEVVKMAEKAESSDDGGYFSNIISEIVRSPIDIALVGIITFLIYKIIKSRQRVDEPVYVEPELPKLRKDFTVEELRKYDGNGPDGRILVAVNGNVYDVTKGKKFYGPGKFNV